jgi:hypothetical protein
MGLIISGLVAVAGFLGLLHALVAIPLKACIGVAPDISLISNEADFLLIVVSLIASWVLGYVQRNTFTYNGVGTRLYGHETTEQGYITTKWLTCVFPLLPIRSYFVMDPAQETYSLEVQNQYDVLQPIDTFLYLPQVLRTGFISYMTLYWGWGSLWVMLNSGFCLK